MKSLFAILFAASLTNSETISVNTPVDKEINTKKVITSVNPQKDTQATNILNAVTNTTKSRKTITPREVAPNRHPNSR